MLETTATNNKFINCIIELRRYEQHHDVIFLYVDPCTSRQRFSPPTLVHHPMEEFGEYSFCDVLNSFVCSLFCIACKMFLVRRFCASGLDREDQTGSPAVIPSNAICWFVSACNYDSNYGQLSQSITTLYLYIYINI